MTIRQLIEDTVLLAENGRHVGALTTVLAAISGSSRKVFPRGPVTPSRWNPQEKKGMLDKEAFCLFLGGRLRKMLTGNVELPDDGTSGIEVAFQGKSIQLEALLYEQFRCSLSHEGRLPASVAFRENTKPNLQARSFAFSIDGGVVSLNEGWLAVLIAAVTEARCNAADFGIQHFVLRPKEGINGEALLQRLAHESGASVPRLNLLLGLLSFYQPPVVAAATDEQLGEMLRRLLDERVWNQGALSGLATGNLATHGAEWTATGRVAIRSLAQAYELVAIT